MAARKTAAQKAAEAAEREEYTGIPESTGPITVPARKKAPAEQRIEVTEPDGSTKLLTLQQLKNRLRNEAEREVLDDHRDEVIAKTGAKYDAYGLEYVRRLTDQEKAAKDIAEKLTEFPELRALFAAVGAGVVFADVHGNPEPEPEVVEGWGDGHPDEFAPIPDGPLPGEFRE